MITALAGQVQAHHTAAQITITAAMVYGFAVLILGVVRTNSKSSRHARFYSPPRPWRALKAGRRSEAYRRRTEKRAVRAHRRAYATTKSKHATHTAVRTA